MEKKYKRKLFLLLSFFFLLSVSFFGYKYLVNTFSIPPNKQYNFILISIDTLRPDHMGVYGYNRNTTPNIDNFGKKAYIFTNAYTQIPQTYPSFSALMTGIDPINSGIYRNKNRIDVNDGKISPNTKTLAKIFHENNYFTAAFITSPTLDDNLTNLSSGFDEYNYYPVDVDKPDANKYYDSLKKISPIIKSYQNKKFFLWIHLMDPHSPYFPPEKFRAITIRRPK